MSWFKKIMETDGESFKGKFYLLILDKLLIGGIIALAFVGFEYYRNKSEQEFEKARRAEDRVPELISGIENEKTRVSTIATLAKNDEKDLVFVVAKKFPSEALEATRKLEVDSKFKEKVKRVALASAKSRVSTDKKKVAAFFEEGEKLIDRFIDLKKKINVKQDQDDPDDVLVEFILIRLDSEDLIVRIQQNLVSAQNNPRFNKLKLILNELEEKIKSKEYDKAMKYINWIVVGVKTDMVSKKERWDELTALFNEYCDMIDTQNSDKSKKGNLLQKIQKAHDSLDTTNSYFVYLFCNELGSFPVLSK